MWLEFKIGSIVLVVLFFIHLIQKNNELTEENEELKKLAYTDQLTGALTRRVIERIIPKEMSRVMRTGQQLVLAMLDLDHFKKINDTYGHQAGDMVLKETIKRAREFLRDTDYIIRYGGEEFLLLLPECQDGKPVFERFRKVICEQPFYIDENKTIQVTTSIGFSVFTSKDTKTQESLIGEADAALYEAKKQRNMVVGF